jgi:hypothetical protein
MTAEEFERGLATVVGVYPAARVLPEEGTVRPLRIDSVSIPLPFWGGGTTRLLVVFDLAMHEAARPRGLLGPEWKLPGGGIPQNASAVYEFGEAWQAFSWSFIWPPALSMLETVEAYLGRFNDLR